MKTFIIGTWEALMDSRRNPLRHLDLASQHYTMQVLGWMWSMIFSLSFLSIFQFGYVWAAHLLLFGGMAMTVAVFRQSEHGATVEVTPPSHIGRSSATIWKLDSEA